MQRKPVKVAADQRARFIEAARKAEVDESGKKFERAIKKIMPRAKRQRAKPATQR